MEVKWEILGPILMGVASLAGVAVALYRALRLSPSEVRSADATAAKSYAEAARLAAEQASQTTQRNNALEEALRRTSARVDEQGEQITQLKEQQRINMDSINVLQRDNARLVHELSQVKAENERLKKSLETVMAENEELKAQYRARTTRRKT